MGDAVLHDALQHIAALEQRQRDLERNRLGQRGMDDPGHPDEGRQGTPGAVVRANPGHITIRGRKAESS